ncbi:MAG: hypothetical protein AABW99_01045 [archaeon]
MPHRKPKIGAHWSVKRRAIDAYMQLPANMNEKQIAHNAGLPLTTATRERRLMEKNPDLLPFIRARFFPTRNHFHPRHMRMGLVQAIEAALEKSPDRVPATSIARKFKSTRGNIVALSKKLRDEKNIVGKRGGANSSYPEKVSDTINKFYEEASRAGRASIMVKDLIIQIAREHGVAVSGGGLRTRLRALNKNHWAGIKIVLGGLYTTSDTIKLLEQSSIPFSDPKRKARGFKT